MLYCTLMGLFSTLASEYQPSTPSLNRADLPTVHTPLREPQLSAIDLFDWHTHKAHLISIPTYVIYTTHYSAMATSSALHSFFASTFPILPVDATTCVSIVQDNAKGLVTASSVSERRRLQDARRTRIQALYTAPTCSKAENSSRLSRWESELPDLSSLTASPLAPNRRPGFGMPSPPKEAASESVRAGIGTPKIPRRRTCLEVQNEDAAGQVKAPVVPQRKSSFLSLPGIIEPNTSPPPSRNDVPKVRLQPRSRSPQANSLNSMVNSASKNLGSTPDTLKSLVNRKSSLKNAPRRPRRMKSMEPDDGILDTTVRKEEDSLRCSLTNSIHSVLDQMKHFHEQETTANSSSSYKLALEDSVKGVVVSLSQSKRSTLAMSKHCDLFQEDTSVENGMMNLSDSVQV